MEPLITESGSKKISIDPKVFIPAIVCICVLIGFTLNDLEAAKKAYGAFFSYITHNWGWLFSWNAAIFVGITLWLAFGPYGNMKLGDEKPEFSTFSWLFMMYASSTSAAVLFWGTIEAYYYTAYPPFGFEAMSVQAKEYAMAYSLFHWGPYSWCVYSGVSVAFAYFFYVKKVDAIRPTAALTPLLGEKHCKGLVGIIIDNFYVISLILATGTSLGLATPLVTECMQHLFGIKRTLLVDSSVIALWVAVVTICVAFGLTKGLKMASNIRTYLTFFVLIWVFVLSGTVFILDYFTDSVGLMLSNMNRMIFYTDPFDQAGGFPKDWTVFYYAWWAIFTIQTCIFLARISRGRTVRELALGSTAGLSLAAWMIWSVLGGNTMHTIINNLVDVQELIKAGDSSAIVAIWAALPASTITVCIFFILCFIATITLINAQSYTLAMAACKNITGYDEPPLYLRVVMSVVVGVLAISLLAVGGLKPIQSAIIGGGCLLVFINAMVYISFLKDARATKWLEKGKNKKEEELLAAMRQKTAAEES